MSTEIRGLFITIIIIIIKIQEFMYRDTANVEP